MKYGYVRVAAAVPRLKVANPGYNSDEISEVILKAYEEYVQFIVFPELCITSYTCGDLFHQKALLDGACAGLTDILDKTSGTDIVAIVGLPVICDNQLFNCGAAIQKGKILGIVPKSYIPGYGEFYEERWFAPASKAASTEIMLCGQDVPFGSDLLFCDTSGTGVCFGIEVCEDLWVPIPPSSYQSLFGAELLFNLSASNEVIGKHEYRKELVKQQSAKCIAAYVFTSSGVFESTTDVVFGGHSIIAEYGNVLAESERFKFEKQVVISEVDIDKLRNDRIRSTSYMEIRFEKKYRKIGYSLKQADLTHMYRKIDAHPFVPSNTATRDDRCSEIFAIQTSGLAKRLLHTGMKHAVIGVSGGLDSTLALLVAVKTFDMLGISRQKIIAVTMPGFGTTEATYTNAVRLMNTMGVSIKEIDIKAACLQHFKDIGHDIDSYDVTYENVQARERTQVLMDIANKCNALVIGTGDLSELALGWCTYNGDHMSMYSVNCGVPKTLVKFLVQWVAENIADDKSSVLLTKIIDTPISPELLPPKSDGTIKQKTEDIVGPYEMHDFFLYYIVRCGALPDKIHFLAKTAFGDKYSSGEIKKWQRTFYKRFFSQQFKRSCLPDGPKVGTISLSPRGDFRMPSDACADLWLNMPD